LSFDIVVTSNFRSGASNTAIMTNLTFAHIQQNTNGLGPYKKNRKKLIGYYNKYSKQFPEENPPKKGGKVWKAVYKEISKIFPRKTGHSVGGALDISSKSLTRQQVSDVMYVCYFMRVSWVMLEHHVPHIHVSITKSLKTFPKKESYDDPQIVDAFLDKLNKNYEKNKYALPSMSTAGVV
jgi:hypothetical protein